MTNLSGSTLISSINGLSKRIDTFHSLGVEKIWSFYKSGFIDSFSTGMFTNNNKLVKLTLLDGRTIACTSDTQVMIVKNDRLIYKNINNILIKEYKIVMGIEFTEDKIYNDEKDWILELSDYTFEFNNEVNRNQILAFARLLGYLFSDEIFINNKRITIDHPINAISIIQDIELVDQNINNTSNDIQYINLSNKLCSNIMSIDIINDLLLLKTCPRVIIREFLGSFFGAAAFEPTIIDGKFTLVCYLVSIFESLISVDNLIILLERCNVKSYVESNYIYITSSLDFMINIGFRYSLQKSARLNIAASYERTFNNYSVKSYIDILDVNLWFASLNEYDEILDTSKSGKNRIPHYIMPAVNIMEYKIANAFNIEVAYYNNFIANGILVYN